MTKRSCTYQELSPESETQCLAVILTVFIMWLWPQQADHFRGQALRIHCASAQELAENNNRVLKESDWCLVHYVPRKSVLCSHLKFYRIFKSKYQMANSKNEQNCPVMLHGNVCIFKLLGMWIIVKPSLIHSSHLSCSYYKQLIMIPFKK